MRSHWFWLLANCALIAFMFLGMRVLENGPTPLQTDFDAARSFKTLDSLNPGGFPHPTGSDENRRVRERIEATLESYGYEPSLQTTDLCTSMHAGCTAIENIIAVKKGAAPDAGAILVTAHYDSAPVAPGAGDDLAGVAAMLETARVTAQENFRNEIIFLFADGEETGLRGAMAFAWRHPAMARVKLAINFEGRGVSGPSAMFETSDNNARLIEIFSGSAHRPVANSLMFEVYRKMPNNTDMTIYKQAGAAGLNFAFSRGVALYHSSRDNAGNLNLNSIAHHGDNLLSVLRAAASMDLSTLEAKGDASYFDIFGYALVHWPASLNLPVAAAVLLLIFFIGARTGAFRARPLLLAVAGAVALLAGLVLFGWALSYPLGIWPGIHPLDHPHPWPARISLVASSLLAAFLCGVTLFARAGASASLFVNWTIITLIALALAVFLPGGAYLALAPALIFAVAGALETFVNRRRAPIISAILGLCLAAYMSVYHFLFFDVVLNFQVSYLKTPILALAALACAPLVSVRRNDARDGRDSAPATAIVIASVMALSAGFAMFAEPYTAARPRSVNISYFQTGAADGETSAQSSTRWRLFTYGPVDKAFRAAAGFPEEPDAFRRFGGAESKAYFVPAKNHRLAAPRITVISDDAAAGVRIIKGEISAGRAGAFFGVTFPADTKATQFLVNGEELIGEEKFQSGAINQSYFNGFGARALPFELHVAGEEPVELTVFEVSPLPDDADGRSIIEKRPANAAAIHFGDHAEVQQTLRL